MRHLIIVFLCFTVTACATGPYRNRVIKQEDGTEEKLFFAYGKFCGPDYPKLKPGRNLIDFWPPLDDVDAICYAHDQCYANSFDHNDICDSAFIKTLNKYSMKLKADGCWGLTGDVIDGFFAKNYGKGETETETFATQLTHSTAGLFFAVLLQTVRSPLNFFSKPAVEGTCNVEATSNPRPLIEDFQKAYLETVLNKKKSSILIPMPALAPAQE